MTIEQNKKVSPDTGGSRGRGGGIQGHVPQAHLPPPPKDPSFNITPMAVHGKKGAISAICPPPKKKKRPAGSANVGAADEHR